MCNYTMDHQHLTSEAAALRQKGSGIVVELRFVIIKKGELHFVVAEVFKGCYVWKYSFQLQSKLS